MLINLVEEVVGYGRIIKRQPYRAHRVFSLKHGLRPESLRLARKYQGVFPKSWVHPHPNLTFLDTGKSEQQPTLRLESLRLARVPVKRHPK